jgi:hypothetical protein
MQFEVKPFEVRIGKAFGEEGEMLEVVATDREVIALPKLSLWFVSLPF